MKRRVAPDPSASPCPLRAVAACRKRAFPRSVTAFMKVVLALLLFCATGATGAAACSIVVPWHEVEADAAGIDTSAPDPPAVAVESIRRGHAASRTETGAIVATSCDDIGFIALYLEKPATDDLASAAEMGYVIRLVDGEAPRDLMPVDRAIYAGEEGRLILHWVDGATSDQEPLDFTIEIAPVDRAGNEGPSSEPLRIQHRGSD